MSAAVYIYKLKRMQVSQSYTDSVSLQVLFTPLVQYISRPQRQSCTTEREKAVHHEGKARGTVCKTFAVSWMTMM